MSTTYLPKPIAKSSGFSLWGSVRNVVIFLRDNWLFTLGLSLLLALILIGFIGGLFVDPEMAEMGAAPLNLPPSAEYPLGTDGYVRTMTVELMALIVGLLAWPLPARVIRSQTLSMRERLFIQVAKLNGQNDWELIFLQIFPNLTSFVAAAFVGTVSSGILAAVGLE